MRPPKSNQTGLFYKGKEDIRPTDTVRIAGTFP
nr:MAG TPA: hypothetical protein [Caudoviricetes sp.]DAS42501.1 MAG TPA: hypothetical protein [Caudoviricetes sp.]